MRRALSTWLPLAGFLLLAGCGTSAGDDCEGGGFVCDSDTQALECRGGQWRALPCRGPLGCSEVEERVRCDMSANNAGDACASSAEGRAQCRGDGKALLECREGELVETQACQSCVTSGSEVTCAP
ncbi:hypothetical protein P2318_14395 [Myxococcaceae bacterium GXIMD 01537]